MYPSWSSESPVCAGETYQDPKDGTIIRVVRVRTRSRLMDAVDTAKQQWSKKSFVVLILHVVFALIIVVPLGPMLVCR